MSVHYWTSGQPRVLRLCLRFWPRLKTRSCQHSKTEIFDLPYSADGNVFLGETKHRNRQSESNFSRPLDPSRLPSFTNEYFDDECDIGFYPPPRHGHPDLRGGFTPSPGSWSVPPNKDWISPEGPPYMRSKDVWRDVPTHGQVPARYVGDHILKSLQYTRDSDTRAVALHTPKAATFSVRILSITVSFTGNA